MRDFGIALLGLFAAVAPLGAVPLLPAGARRAVAVGASAVAFGLLAGAAALSEPLLGWLDVSGENFQLAAGLLMLPQAFHLLVRGESMSIDAGGGAEGRYGWLAPLAFPVLASPASLAAAVAYSSRFDPGVVLAAVALVVVLTAAVIAGGERCARYPLALAVINRFAGALLVMMAVELMVDGVRSV